MFFPEEWEFCRKPGCRDRESLAVPRDRFFAREWLQSLKADIRQMSAMRALAGQENNALPLSRISDDAVIDQVVELLVGGGLHVHAAAAPAQSGSARGTSGQGPSGQGVSSATSPPSSFPRLAVAAELW